MKKGITRIAVFLFVLGVGAAVNAKEDAYKYGPLVLDNASVLPSKTLEVIGFYNSASPTIELESPPGPGGKTQTTEVDLPVSGINGAVSYGLTDNIEVGISASRVSRNFISTVNVSGTAPNTTVRIVTGEVSGMSDLIAKAKFGNNKVAGTLVLFLPTGEEGIAVQDNDMDIALKFAWTPVVDRTGGLHLNLGYTKWGKDDMPGKNNAEQTGSFDYGLGLEFFLGRSKSSSLTVEYAGNTLEDARGNTPMDVYTGFRIGASKSLQITGLFALGITDGSTLTKWGIGWGLGMKWVGDIF